MPLLDSATEPRSAAIGSVKDRGLAESGRSRIAWAAAFMPVLAQIRDRFAKRSRCRRAHRRVPARDDRNGEPDAGAASRRRRDRALREQPALDAGRRRRGALRLRHPDLRDQRRRQRHLLLAHRVGDRHASRRSRWTTAAISSRRSSPSTPSLLERHDRRLRGDDDRRHPPAGDAEGRRAALSGRSRSTTR